MLALLIGRVVQHNKLAPLMGGVIQHHKLAPLIGGVVQLNRLLHMGSQCSAVRLAVLVCCSALHMYVAVRVRLGEYFLTE